MKRTIHLLLIAALLLTAVPFAFGHEVAEKVFVKAGIAAELLDTPNIRVIDCRRDEEAYKQGHIPGAIFYNVFKDLRVTGAWDTVGVRRQLEEQEEMFGRQFGIGRDTMVLLYDDEGWDATRLFWELKQTGHDKVAIIFGGWQEWTAKGLAVSTEVPTIAPALYVSNFRPESLATASYVLSRMGAPDVVLLDARTPAEFKGEAKHPKAKIGGRLPGAVNLFTLAHWENKTYLKDPVELEAVFAEQGVTRDKEVIVYCNTGYFAANTYFILKALGYPHVRVYDYSWVEWNGKGHLPKVLSPKAS